MAITGNDLLKKRKGTTKEDEEKKKGITGSDLLKAYKTNTKEVDQKYIDTFINDANTFFTSAEKDYEGLGWANASSSYDSRNSTWQDLNTRADTIEAWLFKNRSNLGGESYDSLNSYLNEFRGGGSSVLDTFKSASDYYSKWNTEEDYNKEVSEREGLMSFDLEAGKTEIDDLEAQLAEANNAYGKLNNQITTYGRSHNTKKVAELREQQKQLEETINSLQSTLSQKNQYYTLADRAQKAVELASVADPNSENYDKDFDKYAQIGAGVENPTLEEEAGWLAIGSWNPFGEDPKNKVTYARDNYEEYLKKSMQGAMNGGVRPEAYQINDLYWEMTEEEVALHNYYLAKDMENGTNYADEYLDTLADTLEYRKAEKLFAPIKDKPLLEYAFGIAAGLDQFASGIEALFSDEDYIPTSAVQYASGMTREDLADNGAKLPDWLGGESLGQVGYDVITTTSNMLPSILVSTIPVVGQVAGVSVLGASAAGNAKADMLRLGYSKEQASTYGIMVGIAEGAMEYLLGGISKLGGKLPEGVIAKILTKVDNAFARTAIKIGGSMLSEGLEEGLQTIIEPWLAEIATGVDWDAPNIDEVLYSSLLGALSAFALEGGTTIAGEVGTYKSGKTIQKVDGGVAKLQSLGSTFSADTVAYKIASKVNENTDAYTIGRLLNEVGATLSEQNVSDIIEGLTSKGIRKTDATKIARGYQAYLNSEMNLSDEAVKTLEGLSPLADVLRTNIIGSNTTIYQRAREYSDLMKLADEVSNPKKSKTTESTREEREESNPSMNVFDQQSLALDMQKVASDISKETISPVRSSIERQMNEVHDKATEGVANALGVKGIYSSTETGSTRLKSNRQRVDIVGVASLDKEGLKLKLKDGSVVDAKDINFRNTEEALVYEAVANMGVSANTAWEIIKGFDPKSNQKGAVYAMGALEAYTYGHNGVKVDGMSKNGFSALLSTTQQNTANKLGDIDARAKVDAEQSKIDAEYNKVRNEAKSKGKPIPKRSGQVVFEGERSKLTTLQESQFGVLEKVAEGLGVTFHIFESTVDANGKRYYKMPNGKYTSANGWYDPKTGEIWIDLYAGNDGQGTMIFTAAHELTHFIKQWSPAKFKIFADFLFEQYGKKGQDVNELIRNQMEKAKANGRTISWDEAYEEVVADSTETFLRDSKAAEKIAALREKDTGLANKIKSFLGQMLAKMRKVMADLGLAPETKEGKMVAEMTDSLQKLYDLWTDALADAGRKYSVLRETDTETDSGYHYHERDFPINAEINQSMTMEQAKQMIQRAFVLGGIKEWYDGEYKNGDEWARAQGADEVAMYVENEYQLQELYINKIPGILDERFFVSDVIEAYLNGTLTGKVKQKAQKLNLADSVKVADPRFYAPQAIADAKALYEVANQRVNDKNRAEVYEARAKILLYAHNKGAAETLGITVSDLNKKLRSWSNYSSKAKDASIRINKDVEESNRWTGIENMSYISKATVSADEVVRMVKAIEGKSDDFQNSYIARTMLALDTHIDWSWLTFKFDTVQGVNESMVGSGRANGYYRDTSRLIHCKKDAPNTVAHEMGHALDHQWGRDLGLGSSTLTEAYRNTDRVSGDVKIWFEQFKNFADDLAESASLYSEYTMDIKEVFARFVAKFVEWTEVIATGRSSGYETSYYNDKFTTAQFVEFARILQGKAALDANGLTANKVGGASSATHNETVNREDVNYSLAETVTGKLVAVVDDDILSGIYTGTWDKVTAEKAKKAAKTALLKFKGGIAVKGITAKVNKTSRDEYTRSDYSEALRRHDPNTYADKLRAASVADDVVIAATNWMRDGGLTHPRKDDFVDFDRGQTLIMSGANKYTAEVIVGITSKGEFVFYDVEDMNPTQFDIKDEGDLPAVTPDKPFDAILKVSNGDIVSQDFELVNRDDENIKYSIREEAPPKKTEKAYKLMRLVDGKLYPLFIGNNEEVSVGTWYNADSPNLSQLKNLAPGTHLVDMKTGEAITWDEYAEKYVPKKNGKPTRSKPNIDDVHWANDNGYRFMHIEDKAGSKSESRMQKQYGDTRAYYNWGVNGSSKSESGEGSASLYALRPGWHFGEVPTMHQIGYDGVEGDTVRLDNQVWVEVEMSADVDYNAEAASNWGGDIPTHIPTNGYYKFATNPTQKKTKGGNTEADLTKSDWYVAGAFKVNRILSDSEADSIVEKYNKEHGKNVPLDYRRNYGRVFNAETMSIEDSVRYSDRILMGSLFSGGGTLEAGLTYQMLDKQFGVEYDGKIASVYADNHGDHIQVGRVEDFDISKYDDIFYLHASPVCHNFSKAKHGATELQMDIDSARATAKHLETAMPQVFTVENAPGYLKSQSLKIITDKLTKLGYKWDVDIYNSADYGSATSRNRVILRAVKDGELPAKPTKQDRTNSWDKVTRDLWDALPKSYLRPSFISAIENTPKLPILDSNGKVNINKPLLILTTTNGHMVTYCWEGEICPTLTTKCGEAKLVLPDGNIYAVTPEFMGRIQGLPDDYKYPKEKTRAFTIIGNGIPTHLTKAVVGGVLDSAYEQTHDGEVLYSDRSSDSVSNRTLLANALESVAQNDIERNKLSQYKEKIALIEAEQEKLAELRGKIKELSFAKGARDAKAIRSLQFEANETANRINTYDRQLLNLESTTALKGVLEREKQMAYQKAKKEGKDALAKQKERAAKTQRELMNRYQESRQKGIESRNRTEMRHKIQKVVGDLKALLLDPTKEKHVPIGLQKPVADALDIINMDTVGADERIARYNALIAKANDPDVIAELTKTRDRIELQGENLSDKLTALKLAYADIKNSDDPLVRDSHNEAIEDLITNTAKIVGSTSIRDMSYEQLEAVYDMYKAILATVRNANKIFKAVKQESITDKSELVKREVREAGGHRDRVLKATKWLKKFGWNMLKPIYAMKMIGSDTLTRLYENVRKGEDTWAVDVNEAKEFFRETAKKYNYNSWDFKKQYSFKDSAGASFSLSVEQIMSLYAYSKRNQADKHLEIGGFIFDDSIEVIERKGKFGIPLKYEVNDANPYRLKKGDLGEIISILDTDLKEVKGFVDEMQAYLSDVMGAKGNEVSLAMYDIKLYKEKNYFPLKTAKYFREFDPEKNGTPKIKNSGFSKKTVPQAGNPIILSNFMDVWANHVNDMSMYHAFVLPLEDFMRVYNYSSTAGGYDSVQQYIKNAYGSQANSYIETLMNDLNGGARTDPSADVISKGLSLFKKAKVFASLSVVIQQPSAIARAMAYVDAKYFVDKPSSAKHNETWAEVKKYAPVAIIKEMGYFDTNMGRSTVDFITSREYDGIKEKFGAMFTDSDYRDEVLSKAPALADELAWCAIWKAVKRETLHTHPNLKPNSEEFLKAAGERFTEVITKTQVYDSVLSRSAMMRSKDTGMKMATAFMAEPTTSINMAVDAIVEGKRGNKAFTRKALGSIAASVILNSILVSLVYAMRDDDEDETYTEKYLESLTTELIDGFNPLTYIPFVKDLWSIAQGFDIERSDMSLAADLWESIENLFSEKKSGFEKVEGIVGDISSVFGLPVANIMRDARGMYNLVTTVTNGIPTTASGVGDAVGGAVKNSIPLVGRFVKDESKGEKLYDAIVKGDTAHAERLKSGYEDEDSANTAIRKYIGEAYRSGEMSYTEAMNALINYGGYDSNKAYWKLREWDFDIENGTDAEYSKYTDFYEAVRTGKNIKAVIKEYTDQGVKASTLAAQITSYYKPLYKEMSNAERASIKGYLLNAYVLLGYNRYDKSKDIDNWLKD